MVNRVILGGNLGKDPETFNFQNGGKVVSFSVATSESWRDQSGQRQTKTEWHDVKVWNEALAEIAANHLRKGSKVYLEGQIETRKFTDKEGKPREAKEIAMRFNSALTMLDAPPSADRPEDAPAQARRGARREPSGRN
jgi:single-strand DNA-binding protein